MQYPLISELEDFYRSDLGQLVFANIADIILNNVNNLEDDSLGIGYTVPYNKFFQNSSKFLSIISSNMVKIDSSLKLNNDIPQIISKFTDLPIKSNSINNIFVIHGLEFEIQQKTFLREMWRILKPSGKLIIILPNKISMFNTYKKKYLLNHNKLFTVREITELLKNSMFSISHIDSTIFTNITLKRVMPLFSNTIEDLSKDWLSLFGMLLVVKAQKLLSLTITDTNIQKGKHYLNKIVEI